MKTYTTSQIRNVGVFGHGGEGKTTLVEAMLFNAGHIDRMGKVDDGTATMDYDAEEIRRQISISAAIAPVEWNNYKVNLIDAPGYFDFEGEVLETISVADAALIVTGAVSGYTVGAEKAWNLLKKRKLPRAIVVNRMDTENANFENVVKAFTEKCGKIIAPVQLPIMQDGKFIGYVDVVERHAKLFDGKQLKDASIPAQMEVEVDYYHTQLVEAAAENDEALMEKYFGGEELSTEELIRGISIGVYAGELVPVFCTSASMQLGISTLLDYIINYFPSPDVAKAKEGVNPKNDEREKRVCSDEAPFSAQVFKTNTDLFVGKISLFKIYSGTLTSDTAIYNPTTEKNEKVGGVYMMRGKKTYPIEKLCAGDVGAVAKLQYTVTGDTLCDPVNPIKYESIEFPKTAFTMAVSAKKSGEEDKVFGGLNKLMEEDPTFKLEKRADTGDMLISGLGEMHLDVICNKLKNKFAVEAKLGEPTVPYRETIRKSARAQGRHKKQSGGHGQFGDVYIVFEPILDGSAEFEFVDKIVGGVVPRNYIPAVEKGLREAVTKGVLAGYPMINIRCTLDYGSYHPVDSNELAFRMAARIAYKKGCAEASPVLLEPIYRYEVYVPDEYMGDVIGDMNRRRGRIMGMNPTPEGQQVVAEVPYAEMFKYATDLRSMTQGRGRYEAFFERYEDVPSNLAAKIIEKAKKNREEDEE